MYICIIIISRPSLLGRLLYDSVLVFLPIDLCSTIHRSYHLGSVIGASNSFICVELFVGKSLTKRILKVSKQNKQCENTANTIIILCENHANTIIILCLWHILVFLTVHSDMSLYSRLFNLSTFSVTCVYNRTPVGPLSTT